MKYFTYTTIIILIFINIKAKAQRVKIDNTLEIEIVENKKIENNFIFIAIHNNEFDAIKTLKFGIENYGGKGYIFLNKSRPNQRVIKVTYNKLSFFYDPNRIFSEEGIIKTLKHYNNHYIYIKKYALDHLKRTSNKILKIIGINHSNYIISLHNNMNRSGFSIKNFKNKKYKTIIKKPLEPKNFVLVSDKKLFEKLSELDINIVFFEPKESDGSLGYFCAKNNYKYINIETKFGDLERQKEILKNIIEKILEERYDYYFYVI